MPPPAAPLPPSDAELVGRVREGDDTAYAELCRRHADAVRRYAATCCRDAHTADDLTAEVFARVLQAVRGGSGPEHAVRAYLLTTVRRVAAQWTRTARREHLVEDFAVFAAQAEYGPKAPGDPAAPGLPGAGLELGADVRAMHEAEQSLAVRAFRSLPERWQAVLWHTEVEDEPPSKVAPLFGLDANGTRVLAGRAREGLKQAHLQAHVSAALARNAECARHAGRLGAYARGRLRARAERGLRRHLEECARCRVAAGQIEEVAGAIPAAVPVAVLGWFGAAGYAKALGILAGGAGAAGATGAAAPVGGGSSGGTGAQPAAGASGASGAGGAGVSSGGKDAVAGSERLGGSVAAGVAAGVAAVAVTAIALAVTAQNGPADKPPPAPPPPASSPMVRPEPPSPAPARTKHTTKPPPAGEKSVRPAPTPAPASVASPSVLKSPALPSPSAPAPEPSSPSVPPPPGPAPGTTSAPVPAPAAPPPPAPAVYRWSELDYDLTGDGTEPEMRIGASSWVWQRYGMSVAGRRFGPGVTVHGRSSVTVALNRACSAYDARAGLDDLTAGFGTVSFSVYADGVRLWRSRVIAGGDPAVPVHVDLTGRGTVRLVVEPRGPHGAVALADWAESTFTCDARAGQ
ncbi:sigma-70 family RNA polymerase sigma factor [Streptomyces sp. NPDC046831]|uniref:sigma-70 family RNA polymerase sigma factor n=1 Tax=Streptomyces sp. NPDC046831 TaxID=3154805 RepID=UPI0033F01E25